MQHHDYEPVISAESGALVALRAHEGDSTDEEPRSWYSAELWCLASALEPAVADLIAWTERGLEPFPIQIGVSEGAIRDPFLAGAVEQALDGRADLARYLEFTVPESALEDVAAPGSVGVLTLQRLGASASLRCIRHRPAALHWARRLGLARIEIDLEAAAADRELATRAYSAVAEARECRLDVSGRNVDSAAALALQRVFACDRLQGRALSGPLSQRRRCGVPRSNRLASDDSSSDGVGTFRESGTQSVPAAPRSADPRRTSGLRRGRCLALVRAKRAGLRFGPRRRTKPAGRRRLETAWSEPAYAQADAEPMINGRWSRAYGRPPTDTRHGIGLVAA